MKQSGLFASFELTELKKIKMDVLSLGIVLLLVGLGLALLIAVIIKIHFDTFTKPRRGY
jgi:uncharacterized membrane protein YqjE